MVNFKNATIALALGLAMIAGAAPAMAKSGAHHPGYAVRAKGVDVGSGVSLDRAKALRECNAKIAPLRDYTWGVTEIDQYRVCMDQHGQPE